MKLQRQNSKRIKILPTEFTQKPSSTKKALPLPTTGGMGTIAITALGVALAFAGVLIIGASRKKTVK